MKDTLKIVTCGSVDDGKSTLIGHMLYDSKLIFADQKKALELDSKINSGNGTIDYSLLLDGLIAEREQKITIDVAYRFFSTKKRNFIIADTPGHVQYTRNMAVGASFADCAIILVDASKGLLDQTKRHFRICSLFGIKDFIFVINKMDIINYSKNVFSKIEKNLITLVNQNKINSLYIIPVSATKGDNIIKKSNKLEWHKCKPLLKYLENLNISNSNNEEFYFPIQRVCRPNSNFRGYQGTITSGELKLNDEIIVYPNKEKAKVTKIFIGDANSKIAYKDNPVTICLNKEIDISRGSIIAKSESLIKNNNFVATILWMDDADLTINSNYLIKLNTQEISATISKINFEIDNDENKIKCISLTKNSIGQCEIVTGSDISYLPFKDCSELGSFILINRLTNATAACGLIEYPLSIQGKPIKQSFTVNRLAKEKLNNHKAITIWLTGLSCSGKSTIANMVEKKLYASKIHTLVLDGDNVRFGLNKDLGFSQKDRSENIRRVAEISKLLNDSGVVSIVAIISPFRNDRLIAKNIIGKSSFYEVFVDTDLNVCEQRDIKGLYKKARNGEIKEFSGVSSPYEKPSKPNLIIRNNNGRLNENVTKLYNLIIKKII